MASAREKNIEIKRLSIDADDGLWFCRLVASNGHYSMTQEFYAVPDFFRDFARNLRRFGKTLRDEAILEAGKEDETQFFRVRAFFYSGVGRAAVEVRSSDGSAAPYRTRAEFSIECETADVNRLGEQLEEWSESQLGPSFVWEPGASAI